MCEPRCTRSSDVLTANLVVLRAPYEEAEIVEIDVLSRCCQHALQREAGRQVQQQPAARVLVAA